MIGQYDGDGRRVKKYVPSTGETTIFVYDASGKTLAEYSTIVAPSSEAKVSYLTSDHLGSPRVLTEQSGKVYSRRDFMPFGEEIRTPQRTEQLGYGGDAVRQKFTGYERDSESGLDFAQARMFAYNHGRFTSPDPLAASANPIRPQSWNRYVYVLNSPLRLIDPTGMFALAKEAAEIPKRSWLEICWQLGICGNPNSGGSFDAKEFLSRSSGVSQHGSIENLPKICNEYCNTSCLRKEEQACEEVARNYFNDNVIKNLIKDIFGLPGSIVTFNYRYLKRLLGTELSRTILVVSSVANAVYSLYDTTQQAVAIENECRRHIPDKCGAGCSKYLTKVGRA
ncbi:MAG: hypothetical protein KatS3mg006_0003 [Pyrinomonadaceae bacterium]|nr:MAG: hypothetical protein KatS3mg006_0003 [Pyrinomonadaceae bacterium]